MIAEMIVFGHLAESQQSSVSNVKQNLYFQISKNVILKNQVFTKLVVFQQGFTNGVLEV